MQDVFDILIDSFVRDKVGIAENFLSLPLAASLKVNLAELFNQKLLVSAGTGNAHEVSHDKKVRSDIIYWLDRSHNDSSENAFLDLMDRFVLYLNQTCYTGITGYEFHYAIFEAGSFYLTHLDQFRSNDSRQYSMILYLNPDWQPDDGGELCIHQNNTQQIISPTNAKSVFFKSSEIKHEVMLTHKIRMSITGWLKV